MKRGTLFRRLVERLPPIVFREYGRRDVCIPAAYHVHEVLRAEGIPARLATYNVIAMNERFRDWFYRREEYGDQCPMPWDAWSVGITSNNPDRAGFLSHLCCVSKGVVIDCAAGGMSRPSKGMPVPGGLLVPRSGVWESEETRVSVHYSVSEEPVPPMWRLDPLATDRVRARIESEVLCGD